ncbi:hypothetical protein LJC51_10615, partial [Lachnospiraceae bacterium OttesenSCG-928-J05]|nr:hypothetical protein [Lachnospiraceae bacterium OttesenSCG-928-J05]
MKRLMRVIAVAMLMALALSTAALAAPVSGTWVEESGGWYFYDTPGGTPYKGWQEIEYNGQNRWFYLDPTTGEMQTDWQQVDGTWYYLNPADGAMITGWLKVEYEGNQRWFYLDATSGAMQTGWLEYNNNRYYLDPNNGGMITGWLLEKYQGEDRWFYLEQSSAEEGIMRTGWKEDASGAWVYLEPGSGAMLVNGVYKIDDAFYHLDENGHDVDGHFYGTWQKKDETSHVRLCECGAEEVKSHSWNEGIVTKSATDTVDGVKTFTCTECGATKSETILATTKQSAVKTGDGQSIVVYALLCLAMLAVVSRFSFLK